MFVSLAKRRCVTVKLPLRIIHNNPQSILNAGRLVTVGFKQQRPPMTDPLLVSQNCDSLCDNKLFRLVVELASTETRISRSTPKNPAKSGSHLQAGTGQNGAEQCLLWVKSGHSTIFGRCLLYPRKRTLELTRVMSALCQKRTW